MIIKNLALILFLGSVTAGGGLTLPHEIEPLPPFEFQGERPVEDSAFLRECENAIQTYLASEPDIKVFRRHISFNAQFGLVCRADFETPDDSDDSVNRLMFWKLPSGELVEFVGFDIPASPLE